MKTVLVIGGGISGLVASINLRNKGYNVILVEKNSNLGGRLYQSREKDYIINNGPSWYWFPSLIQSIYKKLGIKDVYELERLDPQYKIIFETDVFDIPADFEITKKLFCMYDPNIINRLNTFMKKSKYKFQKGLGKFIHFPNISVSEYLIPKLPYYIFKFEILKTYRNLCKKVTNYENIQRILEWPALFIGSSPKNIPGLYTLLTYSMLKEGTYIPKKKGMIEIIELLERNCRGIKILKNTEVKDFKIENNEIKKVVTGLEEIEVDYVLNSADYYHIEKLLPNKFRSYPKIYWDKMKVCPSAILFSITLDIKLPKLEFHNLFFKGNLDEHTFFLYNTTILPPKPLFYVNITTKLFKEAPEGQENLFILIPSNPNRDIPTYEVNRVFTYVIEEISNFCKININNHILEKRKFVNDKFSTKFNSYRCNAYGLSCDGYQNIFIRPKIKSLYLNNLYYCGQMTSPGPGIAPCMVSGMNSSNLLDENDKHLEPIRFYSWWIIMRLVTHFITLFFIIGFKMDLYYAMKREFKYLIFNNLNNCPSYNVF